MRLLLFYDLPQKEDSDKRYYLHFRNWLLRNGFFMIQYLIYVKVCQNHNNAKLQMKRVSQNLPLKGNIRLLVLTEKQYTNMKILSGKKFLQEEVSNDSRYLEV